MAEVRIINQTEASSVTGEEFLLIDDSTAGTKKVSINTVLSDLKNDIGDLDNLETTDKSNLVAAINEAASTGGGEEIIVNDTMTETAKLLIDTTDPTVYQIPEIDDELPKASDTYSSYKIASLFAELRGEIGIGATYNNPVATLETNGLADPCLVMDKNVFYVFTTYSRVNIHKSTDLINWEICTPAITDDDYATLCALTNNQTTYVWAPCVIKRGNLWLMYVAAVAGNTATNCHMCVFSAPNPCGPWKYRGEITNATALSLNDCIDADVVTDTDGKLYMFIGSSYGIYLIRLADDGLSIDSNFAKVLIHPHTPSGSNDTRLEASYCHWRNGYYYLFTSAGLYTQNGGYHIVIARSASLQGPYLNENGDSIYTDSNTGTTILAETTALKSPGHNSNIFTDKNGDDWILFHAYKSGESVRQLCLQRIYWDDSTGWPYFTSGKVASAGFAPKF